MMLDRMIATTALMLVVACSGRQSEPQAPAGNDRAQQPAGDQGSATLSGNQQTDEQRIRRLEEEARRLASAEGCGNAGQCAAAAYGAKACGGPRGYIAYCPLTTDAEALHAKLAELERFERAYNARYGIVSDCMFVMEPPLALDGGRCVARP